MKFKEWVIKNNSIISELYDKFIDISIKNSIQLYDDNKTKKDFAYMLYLNTINKYELSKELYEKKLV